MSEINPETKWNYNYHSSHFSTNFYRFSGSQIIQQVYHKKYFCSSNGKWTFKSSQAKQYRHISYFDTFIIRFFSAYEWHWMHILNDPVWHNFKFMLKLHFDYTKKIRNWNSVEPGYQSNHLRKKNRKLEWNSEKNRNENKSGKHIRLDISRFNRKTEKNMRAKSKENTLHQSK